MTGRLAGSASFTPEPGGLRYRERGVLAFAGHSGEATQSYWFALRAPSVADIAFADGRPFHTLDLAGGRADVAHDCPPDDYRGRYRVAGPDRWHLAWRIVGPRKDLRIFTLYVRTPAVQSKPDCTRQAAPTR